MPQAKEYVDAINNLFYKSEVARKIVLPKGVISDTLLEKEHLVGAYDSALGISFSEQDRVLVEQRIMGSAQTRLILGSVALKEVGEINESYYDLANDDRAEVRQELVDYFTDSMDTIFDTNGALEASQVLNSEEFLNQLDPVDKIPLSYVRKLIARAKRNNPNSQVDFNRLFSYLNVLPGSFPPDGFLGNSLGTNDSVLVQAFGRNSIPDKQLPEIAKLHDSLSDEEVFEILKNMKFDAGDSNRALAVVIRRELVTGRPIEPIVQWEVADALYEDDPEFYKIYQNYIHTLWPKSDFYPTFQVKADSVSVMDSLGIHNPKELSHPDMMIRALGILAKLGVEADVLAEKIPFDARSVQAQARGPFRWTVRESLTRIEHILRNRIKL